MTSRRNRGGDRYVGQTEILECAAILRPER
jgi:hypothetical protein